MSHALRADGTDPAISDAEEAAARRVCAASSLLNAKSPELSRFCRAFYSSASPEDLERFTVQALASLAESVFDRSAVRLPQQTMVELFNFPAAQAEKGFRDLVLLCVNEDMPFLFDSAMEELSTQKLRIQGVFHPVIEEQRDGRGNRSAIGAVVRESTIVLLLDPLLDLTRREELVNALQNVFGQVRLAVRDWQKMLQRLRSAIDELKRNALQLAPEILAENVAFLEWVAANHFTFLGCRDYRVADGGGGRLDAVAESGLGILSDSAARVIGRTADQAKISAEVRAFLAEPDPLIITKADRKSVV